MINWFLYCVKENFLTFNGRASRSEFWYFQLVQFLLGMATGVLIAISYSIGIDILTSVLTMILYITPLVLFLPGLSVAVRRLHDTGRSGLFLLLTLIPAVGQIIVLVFLCQESQKGENEYGYTADPFN